MADKTRSRPFRRAFAIIALVFFGVVYGFFATVHHWFIADVLNYVRSAFITVYDDFQRPWFIMAPASDAPVDLRDLKALQPGLVLLSGIGPERRNFIKVIERDGTVVHSWAPDWFEIWPETPANVPKYLKPIRQPGAILHGVQLLGNGDVIFNFEHLSTIRMSACGDVIWKLDNQGHHSIDQADDGTFWVSSKVSPDQLAADYQNHVAPFDSWAIQNITEAGDILKTVEVLEILQRNDLLGLMHLSSLENTETPVSRDTLHLNDIEVFPQNLQSDVFQTGDLMLSLRNINTILVVDPIDYKVKFQTTGAVLRQHDPDFAPADKIIVYDNRNLEPGGTDHFSRIVEIDARTGDHKTLFRGRGDSNFYSNIMGRVQILENGNLMVASPTQGRAMEVDATGTLLWQLFNNLGDGYAGVLPEAHVLPQFMDKAFFERVRTSCAN